MLVNDTLEIECLVEALGNYTDAKKRHDEARDAYGGYSWEYHGRSYVASVERAAEELKQYFGRAIESKVNEILVAKGLISSNG